MLTASSVPYPSLLLTAPSSGSMTVREREGGRERRLEASGGTDLYKV